MVIYLIKIWIEIVDNSISVVMVMWNVDEW